MRRYHQTIAVLGNRSRFVVAAIICRCTWRVAKQQYLFVWILVNQINKLDYKYSFKRTGSNILYRYLFVLIDQIYMMYLYKLGRKFEIILSATRWLSCGVGASGGAECYCIGIGTGTGTGTGTGIGVGVAISIAIAIATSIDVAIGITIGITIGI